MIHTVHLYQMTTRIQQSQAPSQVRKKRSQAPKQVQNQAKKKRNQALSQVQNQARKKRNQALKQVQSQARKKQHQVVQLLLFLQIATVLVPLVAQFYQQIHIF